MEQFLVGVVMGGLLAVITCFKVLGSQCNSRTSALKAAGNKLIANALANFGVSQTVDVPEGEDEDGNVVPAHTETIVSFPEPFKTQVNAYRNKVDQV